MWDTPSVLEALPALVHPAYLIQVYSALPSAERSRGSTLIKSPSILFKVN
jgi:hypothetical protein